MLPTLPSCAALQRYRRDLDPVRGRLQGSGPLERSQLVDVDPYMFASYLCFAALKTCKRCSAPVEHNMHDILIVLCIFALQARMERQQPLQQPPQETPAMVGCLMPLTQP